MAPYNTDSRVIPIRQVLAFLFVGALNTAFCYLGYLLFLYVGLNYRIAMLFASAITLIVSYLAMGGLVFKSKIHALTATKFVAMHVVGYFVNIELIQIAIRVGATEAFSGLVSLTFLAIYTFIVSRVFVFKQPI